VEATLHAGAFVAYGLRLFAFLKWREAAVPDQQQKLQEREAKVVECRKNKLHVIHLFLFVFFLFFWGEGHLTLARPPCTLSIAAPIPLVAPKLQS
jgi:hypothetical protein